MSPHSSTANLGGGSWPFELGSFNNTSSSGTRATAKGKVRWSAPLPSGQVSSIAVGPDGHIYLASGGELVSLAADGTQRWRVPAGTRAHVAMVLADGRLVAPEAERMVLRDSSDGRELNSWPMAGFAIPSLTSSGHLVYVETTRERSRLLCYDLLGKAQWEVALTSRVHFSPQTQKNLLLVGDGSYVRAFDDAGTLQWIANATEFISAQGADRSALATRRADADDVVDGPVMAIGPSLFLASFRPGQRPPEWAVIDASARSARSLGLPLWLTRPTSVAFAPGVKPRLVGVTPGAEQTQVSAMDLEGKQVWRVESLPAPRSIITDGAGRSFVLCTPTRERFAEYGAAYGLLEQCFVVCIDPGGKELFRWAAPGPLAVPMALGKDGELYAAAENQLWAVS